MSSWHYPSCPSVVQLARCPVLAPSGPGSRPIPFHLWHAWEYWLVNKLGGSGLVTGTTLLCALYVSEVLFAPEPITLRRNVHGHATFGSGAWACSPPWKGGGSNIENAVTFPLWWGWPPSSRWVSQSCFGCLSSTILYRRQDKKYAVEGAGQMLD